MHHLTQLSTDNELTLGVRKGGPGAHHRPEHQSPHWVVLAVGVKGQSYVGLTGIEGVSLLWLRIPEALQPVVSDLEHKAPPSTTQLDDLRFPWEQMAPLCKNSIP